MLFDRFNISHKVRSKTGRKINVFCVRKNVSCLLKRIFYSYVNLNAGYTTMFVNKPFHELIQLNEHEYKANIPDHFHEQLLSLKPPALLKVLALWGMKRKDYV